MTRGSTGDADTITGGSFFLRSLITTWYSVIGEPPSSGGVISNSQVSSSILSAEMEDG